MSEAPPESCGRTFRYTTIACEVIVFAFVGWVVGPFFFGPGGDVLGMLIGALIGTLMMFITLFYISGVFRRESSQAKEKKSQQRTQEE